MMTMMTGETSFSTSINMVNETLLPTFVDDDTVVNDDEVITSNITSPLLSSSSSSPSPSSTSVIPFLDFIRPSSSRMISSSPNREQYPSISFERLAGSLLVFNSNKYNSSSSPLSSSFLDSLSPDLTGLPGLSIAGLPDSDIVNGGHHDDDVNLVNLDPFALYPEKWLRHSPTISLLYCLAYTIVFILGIIGNSFVVAVVFRSPRMRTVTNYFIVNLALADILVLLFCLPPTLISNLFVPWILGLFMCKAVSYLQGVAVSASINTLVAVSVDRFLAICYPLKCQMSRNCARRVIIIIWLFSLVVAFPWALYFTLQPISESRSDMMLCLDIWPDMTSERVYFVTANLFLLYLIPLTIITCCYIAIWLKVWKRHIPGETVMDTGKAINTQMEVVMQRSKLKVAKMMIVVVVIFVISWLPLYIIFARLKLGGSIEQNSLEQKIFMDMVPIAQWLGASNSCINPILYAFFNKKYRKGFAAIVKSRKCCGAVRYEASISTYYNRNTTQRSNRLTARLDTQCDYINSMAAL